MTLSYAKTKELIERVLIWDLRDVRLRLHDALIAIDSNEAEFYAGIVAHGPGMHLSSQQWFELLSRLPTRILRSQLQIKKILSEDQLRRLPPISG